jgi:phytoene dehydrogenase-like protein
VPATDVDAVVVGSGPNGLAAAIRLARSGRSVRVLEAADTIGGGTRTDARTLPGFRHDVCSAVHPLALASPVLRTLPLAEHGCEFVHPQLPLAHPLDGGGAAVLQRSVAETADGLGGDAAAYRRLFGPLVGGWQAIVADTMMRPVPRPPRHPRATARFGLAAAWPATALARRRFHGDPARALFAGSAAHSMQPLGGLGTSAFGLVLLTLGHAVGWPVARGGSQAIADAMASILRGHGGEIVTGAEVTTLAELAGARAVLFDLAPRQIERICGDALPGRYRRVLRSFRHGPGVFKIDYALSEPVPWTAEPARRAGTVHVGGSLEEIATAEAAVAAGRPAERPFVLVAQQSLVDPTRAPQGNQTLWAYCHVPNGSDADLTAAIERQLERFAPGFGDVVLARRTTNARELEAYNASYVGGDINCGAADLRQLLRRPSLRPSPWTTPSPRLFLCGAATPPGGGVHGICGDAAARAALRGVLR